MDKKTLRRIVDNLKREGLLKTQQFQVTIYQDEVKDEPPADQPTPAQHSILGAADMLQGEAPSEISGRTRRQTRKNPVYYNENMLNKNFSWEIDDDGITPVDKAEDDDDFDA